MSTPSDGTKQQRPGLAPAIVSTMSVVVEKDSPDAKFGLGLGTSQNSTTFITSIKDGSLASAASLEVGMIVQTINGVRPKSADEAAQLLTDAPVGSVTIVAATITPGSFRIKGTKQPSEPIKYKAEETIMINHKTFRAPLGVVIGKSTCSDECVIVACEPDSLGAKSGLHILMAVRKVDGTAITSPLQCATLLKNANGTFPVVVAAQVLPEDVPLSNSARSYPARK